jgi:hypothetical protein
MRDIKDSVDVCLLTRELLNMSAADTRLRHVPGLNAGNLPHLAGATW